MHIVLSTAPGSQVTLTMCSRSGTDSESESDAAAEFVTSERTVSRAQLADVIRHHERDRPRWVWSDTAEWYPPLLAAGVSVERCVDLRLCHAILRNSAWAAASDLAVAPPSSWDEPRPAIMSGGLFDLAPNEDADPVREFLLQQAALRTAAHPTSTHRTVPGAGSRLSLLLAAESAGALIAAEMTVAGVPWRAAEHDRILRDLLGPRPTPGYRPSRMEATLAEVRRAFDAPDLNPDSPTELLRALRRTGLQVDSTRSWELKELIHPGIPPLLEYKKLARLLTANGWHWLDTWVADGRFRPTYVPGGVVTGRWASDGGGALQLPHQVRGAVIADPGWTLVVADAAQLEPRILAALSGDSAMARAGRGVDLYQGVVDAGVVDTRQQAKLGMLGAMYGGTSGESGRMLGRLGKAFPRAIALVESAARAGERGEIVSTRLGRSSPPPGQEWRLSQGEASDNDASATTQSKARTQARAWGRFTRNFVVQGTAAEWALIWMATIRMSLRSLAATEPSGPGPHLAFFLHDEVMVHTPIESAPRIAQLIEEAAAQAGRLLFGASEVDFRVSVATVDCYADAK